MCALGHDIEQNTFDSNKNPQIPPRPTTTTLTPNIYILGETIITITDKEQHTEKWDKCKDFQTYDSFASKIL